MAYRIRVGVYEWRDISQWSRRWVYKKSGGASTSPFHCSAELEDRGSQKNKAAKLGYSNETGLKTESGSIPMETAISPPFDRYRLE